MSKELKLDKTSWVKTKLGELAEEISVRVENPSKSQYDRFVGLDCFVSGELKIKKWSGTSNVNSSAKAFKAGDVLFARRNAYLKRASLVEFDGCCSGDAFVLRENHDKIVPGFLSFIVNSEKLWTYANSNAEGTMSKRVKWRDLANYEFLLPPKEQQVELAELLWAMDTVIEKDLEVLERLEDDIQNIFLSKIIDFNIEGLTITGILDNLNKNLGLGLLKDFGTFLKGKGIPKDDVIESGIPCIRYGEIYTSHHIVIRKFRSFISEEVASTSFQLNKGDIVFAGSGETITEIGKSVCFVNDFEAYAGGDTIIFRPDSNKINSVYLSYLLNSLISRLQLNKMGTGATVAHIYPEDLKKIRIPVFDISIQNEIAAEMETIFKSIDQLKSKLQSSKALQKALINQIF